MTKDQIIKNVAKDAGVSQKVAKQALESILASITGALKKKEKVTFIGFGTFSVAQRKARKGLNPQTKKPINIPAKKVPVFKAGSKLKGVIK